MTTTAASPTRARVRELILDLARSEDELREARTRDARFDKAAVRAQQEQIVDELRLFHP